MKLAKGVEDYLFFLCLKLPIRARLHTKECIKNGNISSKIKQNRYELSE